MTVEVNDIVRCSARMKHTISGDVVNVWHWIMQPAAQSDEDVMDAIDDKLDTAYSALNSHIVDETDPYDLKFDIVTIESGRVKTVRVLGSRSWVLTTPPTNGQDGQPPQNAAIINFRTPFPKVFGRKYIGILSEGNQADGNITGPILNALNTFAATMMTDITVGTGTLAAGTLSLKSGPDHNYWALFLGAVVNAITGVQRRRRRNTGS